MHELSLAAAVVDELERLMAREGARGVGRVVLGVGALAGVDSEALRFAFPAALEGSPAQGAALDLESVPLRVRCRACGRQAPAAPLQIRCGGCGDDDVEIVEGADLTIRSVELVLADG